MSEENKQVTMTFSSFDDNQDKTLMFEGPLYVAAVLNRVDELDTFNVTDYEDTEALIVYVRNVNDEQKAIKGEIPYRGSFYRYNWETSTWGQVVLGNHSHSNMAILDQLGEINTADMKIGEKKVLTIKKLNYGDYQIRFNEENHYVEWAHDNSNTWTSWFDISTKLSKYPVIDNILNEEITGVYINIDNKLYYGYKICNGEEILLTDIAGNTVRRDINYSPIFKVEDRKLYWKLNNDENVWAYIRPIDEIRLRGTSVQWKYIYYDYWMDIASTNDIHDTARSTHMSAYQYKLEYEDLPETTIPKVKSTEKRQYLSTDKDGNFSWVESFVPKQTFKLLKIVVSSEFIGDVTSSKTLTLTPEYLEEHEVSFNPEYHDEVIVFDSGKLVSEIATSYVNGSIKLTVTSNKDTDTFELGETITILIIRNGIDGLIDTVQDQYMKKSEVIELLTNGTIHLNDFVTKKDLEDYAAIKDHGHSNYLTKNDYDVFDFRYADFQHTHIEYMTKADVIALLVDSADNEGNIDLEGTVSTLVDQLESYVTTKINDYYTKEQTRLYVESQIASVKYTDAIEVSNMSGMTLTSYLAYLNNKISAVDVVDADTVELEADVVNLGDPNASVGGWKNGERIEKGRITLTDFIHKLLTKEVVPEIVHPEIKVEYSLMTQEAGSSSILHYKAKFEQNDAGELDSFTLKIHKGDINAPVIQESEVVDNYDYTLPLILDAVNEDNLCYTLEIIAGYNAGIKKLSNIGKSYGISAGELTKTISIYNKRLAYFGSMKRDVRTLTADDIYTAVYVSEDNQLYSYDLEKELKDSNEMTIILKASDDVHSCLFAVPFACDYILKEIVYVNQNCDIKDECEKLSASLKDAQGNGDDNNIDNRYNIWYYSFAKPIQTNVPIKLVFRKKEA